MLKKNQMVCALQEAQYNQKNLTFKIGLDIEKEDER